MPKKTAKKTPAVREPKKTDTRYGPDKQVFSIIGLDRQLWSRFRERAQREGHTSMWLLKDYIARYADGAQ